MLKLFENRLRCMDCINDSIFHLSIRFKFDFTMV